MDSWLCIRPILLWNILSYGCIGYLLTWYIIPFVFSIIYEAVYAIMAFRHSITDIRDGAQAELDSPIRRNEVYTTQYQELLERLTNLEALSDLPFSYVNARESDDYLTRLERVREQTQSLLIIRQRIARRLETRDVQDVLAVAKLFRNWWWCPILYIRWFTQTIIDVSGYVVDYMIAEDDIELTWWRMALLTLVIAVEMPW